jgi:hypothetical protein
LTSLRMRLTIAATRTELEHEPDRNTSINIGIGERRGPGMGSVPMTARRAAKYLALFFVGLIVGAILENNYGNEQYGAVDYLIAFMSVCAWVQIARGVK